LKSKKLLAYGVTNKRIPISGTHRRSQTGY